MGEVLIGTSGWQYRHWRGVFYPEDLGQKDWLKYYAKHFDTVEVNYSFYRQPKPETFKKWKSLIPENFVFSIKGNRFITHIKRLKDCQEPVKRFFESAKGLLTDGRGCKDVILWQLTPSMKENLDRLKGFMDLLPSDFRQAFEFRHKSWMSKKVFSFIQNYSRIEAAMVLQDWQEWPILKEPVGDFVYIRLHGKDQLYASGYRDKELEKWAERMRKWESKLDIYIYFNNDALGHAVNNALKLKALL